MRESLIGQPLFLKRPNLRRRTTAAGEHFEQKFQMRNDCLQTIRFVAHLIPEAEVVPHNPQIVFHHLEHPDDDVGNELTPHTRNTKQQFLDSERCCRTIVLHQVKIHPANQDTSVSALKEEMFKGFCIGVTVTLEIDVCHPKASDEAGGGVENTVGDLPVHVDDGTIQGLKMDLVPGFGPMKRAVPRQKLADTMGLGGDATTADLIHRVRVEVCKRTRRVGRDIQRKNASNSTTIELGPGPDDMLVINCAEK